MRAAAVTIGELGRHLDWMPIVRRIFVETASNCFAGTTKKGDFPPPPRGMIQRVYQGSTANVTNGSDCPSPRGRAN